MLPLDLKLFNQYLSLKKLSEKTKREYLAYAFRFQSIGSFNNEAISYFLIQKPNQNNVARSFISILKKYLLYNRKELQFTEQEFKEIAEAEIPTITGRKKQKINIPLTKEEMELLEKTLETEQEKLMFLVCYNGGLRLQELTGIKISDFNWSILRENPNSIVKVLVHGKGNKERFAYIPNWLIRKIISYIRANAFKDGQESKLFNISGDTFEEKIRNAGIKSGITKKGENGEYIESTRIHPHKLRHQLGYDLTTEGYDINYIKRILGHTSISSTQIYTQLNDKDILEKLESRNKPREEVN